MIKIDLKEKKETRRENGLKWILTPLIAFIVVVMLITGVYLLSLYNLSTIKNRYRVILKEKEKKEEQQIEFSRLRDYKDRLREELDFLKNTEKDTRKKLNIVRIAFYKAPSGIKIQSLLLRDKSLQIEFLARNRIVVERYTEQLENAEIKIKDKWMERTKKYIKTTVEAEIGG